jgi:hypothetical protein
MRGRSPRRPFFKPIGHDLLNKLRHGPQELQLPHKPPRHEKNADTDPDGEQHREHRIAHPVEPAAAIAMSDFFHFDFLFAFAGLSRTPAPPPFSATNSTPGLFVVLAGQRLNRDWRSGIAPRRLPQFYARLVSICKFDAGRFQDGSDGGNVVDQPYSLTESCFHPYQGWSRDFGFPRKLPFR